MKKLGIVQKATNAWSAAVLIGGLAAISMGCSLLTPTPASEPANGSAAPATSPAKSSEAAAVNGSSDATDRPDAGVASQDSMSGGSAPNTSTSAGQSTYDPNDSSTDASSTTVSGAADGYSDSAGSSGASSSGPTKSGTITRSVPSAGTSDVQRIEPSPTPEYAPPSDLLPRNTVGLILAVSGGSNTGTLKTVVTNPGTGEMQGAASITMENKSKSVVLYLPDTGEATVVDTYTSASYAPQFKRPYTVNSRLFVSNKFANGGALRLTEYDPTDLSWELEWGTQSDALDPGYAVVGDQVYYKNDTEDRWTLSGTIVSGGEFVRSPLIDQWRSDELTKPVTRFDLVPSEDNLYGAYHPLDENPIAGIFTTDPLTGEPAERYTTAFEIEGLDEYHGASFRHVVIEGGVAYWVAYRNGPVTYTVDVISVDLNDPNLPIRESSFDMLSSSGSINGFNPTFDFDGAHVLIKPFYTGGDHSKLVVHDIDNNRTQLIDTGFHITDAEILYLD